MKNTYKVTFRATYSTGGTTIRVASTVFALAVSAGIAVTTAMGKLSGPIIDYGLTADSITVKLVKPNGR